MVFVESKFKIRVVASKVRVTDTFISVLVISTSSPTTLIFPCPNDQATCLARHDPESAVSTERPHVLF